MSVVAFDTLKYVKTLEEAGFSEKQAEAFVQAQRAALAEALELRLASKEDINGLKKEIGDLRQEVKEDIIGLRQESKNDINRLDRELLIIKWMLGLIILTTVIPLIKDLF